MEIKLNNLEKLQIITNNSGYERMFTTKNKALCIISQLVMKEKISFKNDNTYTISSVCGLDLLEQYEIKFLNLLKQLKKTEIKQFLENVKVTKTLLRKNIIKEEIIKSKINIFNKTQIIKTDLFHEISKELLINSKNNSAIIELFNDLSQKDIKNIYKLAEILTK